MKVISWKWVLVALMLATTVGCGGLRRCGCRNNNVSNSPPCCPNTGSVLIPAQNGGFAPPAF